MLTVDTVCLNLFKYFCLLIETVWLLHSSLLAQYVHPLITSKENQTITYDFSIAYNPNIKSLPDLIERNPPPLLRQSFPYAFTDFRLSRSNFHKNEDTSTAQFDSQISLSIGLSESPTTDFVNCDKWTGDLFPKEYQPVSNHEKSSDQLRCFLQGLNPDFVQVYKLYDLREEISDFYSQGFSLFSDNIYSETISAHKGQISTPKTHSKKDAFNAIDLVNNYPELKPINLPENTKHMNIFELKEAKNERPVLEPESSELEPTFTEQNLISSRQRRLTTYVWEMSDFNDYSSNNSNDYFNLAGWSGDDLKIVLKPISSGGIAAGTNENGSATQGVASNMPVYPDSAIWSPSTRTYNDFLQITGTLPSSITIDASAVKYYMNWHYGEWDISTTDVSTNHYDLIYYSAVPEPSTYIMTGALCCLIGCNKRTKKMFEIFSNKSQQSTSPKKNCKT